MAQGPSDTILVAIRITLRIRESKVRNPDPLDRRSFVLSEHSFLVLIASQSVVMSISVCLFAPYLRNHMAELHQIFLFAFHRGSVLLMVLRYIMYFRFCG